MNTTPQGIPSEAADNLRSSGITVTIMTIVNPVEPMLAAPSTRAWMEAVGGAAAALVGS